MTLFQLNNLTESEVQRVEIDTPPADMEIPAKARKSKAAYRHWCKQSTTDHAFFGFSEGVSPNLRIGRDNPVRRLHGVILEYDGPNDPVGGWASMIRKHAVAGLVPAFLCRSFTPSHGRLFLPFEKPVEPGQGAILEEFIRILVKECKAELLGVGFALKETLNVGQYFEHGRRWEKV